MADFTQTPNSTQLAPSKTKLFFRRIRKYLYLALTLFIILIGIYVYWSFFFTFSDGTRTGTLLKFSRKGTVFKTWEGELVLPNIQSTNTTFSSDKFIFSVVSKDIAAQLEGLQGDYVDLHYKQKNKPLPWRGETVFIVTSAKLH